MSSQNKLTTDRNQRAVLELATKPGNDLCADCKARHPRWASHNLGIFICVNCASIHRKIGTHITKVKSLTMDSWTKDQVDSMRAMGNSKSNSIYNPNEIRNPPPPNLEDTERDSELEQYIRSKYEYRRFIDKSALVASKLGPSRSASMVTSRSVSSPITNLPRTSSPSTAAVSATTASALPAHMKQSTASLSPAQPSDKAPFDGARPTPQRSVSQPIVHQTQQTQVQSGTPQGGVWDDLVALQAVPASSSSLPLQYQQQQAALPAFSQGLTAVSQTPYGTNGYSNGMTTGMSTATFQQQSFADSNPYSQPQSAFAASTTFTQPQSYGQQYFMGQQPSGTFSASSQGQVFHPQPQSTLQVQIPQNRSFLTSSQTFMSAPASQSQFMTPSPAQQFLSPSPNQQLLSHSPQPQLQMQQQPQRQFSSSPSSIMTGMSHGQQQQQTQTLANGQQQMSTMSTPSYGHNYFLAWNQVPQQQAPGQSLQALPQQMSSPAQYNSAYAGGQMYSASSYQAPLGAQQWGAM